MRNLPGWQNLCGIMTPYPYDSFCNPGESVGAFAWPSQLPHNNHDGEQFTLVFDAAGQEMLQTPALLAYLEHSDKQIHQLDRFFTKAFTSGVEDSPRAIRSRFTFRMAIAAESESRS